MSKNKRTPSGNEWQEYEREKKKYMKRKSPKMPKEYEKMIREITERLTA